MAQGFNHFFSASILIHVSTDVLSVSTAIQIVASHLACVMKSNFGFVVKTSIQTKIEHDLTLQIVGIHLNQAVCAEWPLPLPLLLRRLVLELAKSYPDWMNS